VGEDYDIAYMAMELLDGSDLAKYTKKENRCDERGNPRSLLRRFRARLRARERYRASRHQTANIMMLGNREIKVADFGIARVMATSKTQTGSSWAPQLHVSGQ